MLVIKAYFGEEIRRLTLEKDPENFRELVRIIKQLFKNFHRHTYQMKYLDEEQELITLSQDLDLNEALRVVAKNPDRILRLYFKEIPKQEETKELEIPSKANEMLRHASEFVDGLVSNFEKIEIMEQLHKFFEKLFEKQAPPPQNAILEPPKVNENVEDEFDVPELIESNEPEVEIPVLEPPHEEPKEELVPLEDEAPLDTSVIEKIPEQKYSQEVEQLLEMGFSDPLLLQGLLEVNKNDVEQTIVQLLNFVHVKHD